VTPGTAKSGKETSAGEWIISCRFEEILRLTADESGLALIP
jgi:hypothetical protein